MSEKVTYLGSSIIKNVKFICNPKYENKDMTNDLATMLNISENIDITVKTILKKLKI